MSLSKTETVLFEWDNYGGTQYVTYLGKAPFGTDENDDKWEIKKFSYAIGSDSNYHVSEIQTLGGKAWALRASYDWT